MTSETRTSKSETALHSTRLPDQTSSIYKRRVCHTCPAVNDDSRKRDKKRLIVVSIICLLFMIAEIIGGFISNSLAIASDAAHLLTDFGAFMVSLTALWISSKPRTAEMNFGFHRAEVLGALISVLSIWLITGILVYMAIQRLLHPYYELNTLVMIYVSIGGIFANLTMGLILRFYKGGKSEISANDEETLNIRSAVIHVIGDLLQSIGVFVASLIIYFYPNMKNIDPICTFVFSFIILVTTICIMKDIILVLMEGVPRNMNFTDVKNVLYSVPGVLKIHNMRMWSLTLDKVALSAHIIIRKGEKHSDVLRNAMRIINTNLEIYEVTLQLEESEEIFEECSVCT